MAFQERLAELEKLVEREYPNLAGITVLRGGKTRYERCFYGPAPVHVCSVTKSVVSILIGIAIDRGYIKSVDQKVLEFFPDYEIKRGERTIQTITLKHLLTMTAPFKYKSAPYTKVFSSVDWVRASLDLLGGKKPAGEFRYMEMIGPDILTGILTRAVGRSVRAFAQEVLFGPLKISVPKDIVLYTQELHIAFIKNGSASGWVADESGINTAGWGLVLTAKDMAKLGQLYLNKGTWEGRQIVSADWVRESTSEHSRWEEQGLSYGYLWWLNPEEGFAAMGNSGNAIYVSPKQDLVVAVAARFKPTAKDVIPLIENRIAPLFTEAE